MDQTGTMQNSEGADPAAGLNKLEPNYLNCYYAFLFFEPGEAASVKDLQIFWGCNHAKRLEIIKQFELKSLIRAEIQEMSAKQSDDHFISIEPACYEAAFKKACEELLDDLIVPPSPTSNRRSLFLDAVREKPASADELRLEEIRMKILMGEMRFFQHKVLNTQPSTAGCVFGREMVLFEAVVNDRRKLIRRAIRKLNPENLIKLSRQHSQRPENEGKSFLHYLYRHVWHDDTKYPAGHPHEALGINNSYKVILDILRKTKGCSSREVMLMISEPEGTTGLKSLLTAVLNDMEVLSQSNDRAPLIATLNRWRNLYEELKWRLSIVKDPRTSPSLLALLNGNLAKLKEVDYLNNPSNDLSYAACLAARCGHLEIVKWFYENVASPESFQRKDGITPLWMAAKNGHIEVVKWLCEKPEEALQAQKDGTTPLCVAAQNGHLDVVQLLSDVARDTASQPDNDGTMPIWLAAQNGHLEVVDFLCSVAKETASKPRNDGTTPLWIAAQHGHVDVVGVLCKVADSTASQPQKDGATPMWIAAQNGELEVVKVLCLFAKKSALKTDNDGTTPLWIAAQNGHLHVVEFLANECNASASMPNKNGETPLMIAAANGHLAVVKLLAEQVEETVSMPDKNGLTPLSAAAEVGNLQVVEFLAKIAPSTATLPQNNGATPIWLAAQNGHFDVVKCLAQIAPKTAWQTEKDGGTTPLWIAAQNCHVEVVKVLAKLASETLSQGNRIGSTPLWIAAATNQVEMVRLLCDIAETTVSLPNNEGMTPMWIAAANGHLEVVKLLAQKTDHSLPAPGPFGLSPAQVAEKRGHTEIADLLVMFAEMGKKRGRCVIQ